MVPAPRLQRGSFALESQASFVQKTLTQTQFKFKKEKRFAVANNIKAVKESPHVIQQLQKQVQACIFRFSLRYPRQAHTSSSSEVKIAIQYPNLFVTTGDESKQKFIFCIVKGTYPSLPFTKGFGMSQKHKHFTDYGVLRIQQLVAVYFYFNTIRCICLLSFLPFYVSKSGLIWWQILMT